MAPGISSDHAEPVGEASVQLQSETIVRRIPDWLELHDRISETGREELRNRIRPCLDLRQRRGEPIQGGLTWGLQVRWQEDAGRHLRLLVDTVLHVQVNAARAQVAGLKGIVFLKYALDADVPLDGVRELLIRDVVGSRGNGIGAG